MKRAWSQAIRTYEKRGRSRDEAMVDQADRHDITDHRERPDRRQPTERKEPTESTEPADPTPRPKGPGRVLDAPRCPHARN